ncbi:MAG: M14 family metallopeptidase [Parasphingorhabdus sp.]
MITYAAARTEFLEAASRAGAELCSYPHPRAGPDDQALAVDVARLGSREAPAQLVLVSGVHDVEGYAGSMIQAGLVEAMPAASGFAIVFVYGVNPYGMANYRRVTEKGVDLNRNFIDFSGPLPVNEAFDEEFARLLTPAASVKADSDRALLQRIAQNPREMRAAIAGGQYAYPYSPSYGGKHATWARKNFEIIVGKELTAASQICLIDFHTGLGNYGRGQFIGSHWASAEERRFERNIWGDDYVEGGDPGTVSYVVSGDLLSGLRRLMPQAEVAAAAHEFGTLAEQAVLDALRIDHSAALANARDEQCKKAMFDAFMSCGASWKRDVLEQAMDGVEKAARWLS